MRDLNSDSEIGVEDLPPGMRDRAGRRPERAKEGKDGAEAKEPRRFTLDRLLGRTDRRLRAWTRMATG